MARDSNGLRFLPQQLLDYGELQWAQDEQDERRRLARLAQTMEAGWFGEYRGPTPDFGWEIYDGGAGELSLRTLDASGVPLQRDPSRPAPENDTVTLGVDPIGQVLEQPIGYVLESDDTRLLVPNDGVWRTLIAHYRTTQHQPGTLTVAAGSTAVVGDGTRFTRLNDGTVGLPDKIRVDAADTSTGNEGVYTIAAIGDDTHMTIVETFPEAETGMLFRVQGRFRGTEPADPDIHRCALVSWELVTRTCDRPTDGLIAYDVMRTGGTLYLIDRRRGSLWRPPSAPTIPGLQPVVFQSVAGALTTPVGTVGFGSAVNDSYGVAVAVAPAATGSHAPGIAEDQPTGMLAAVLFQEGGTTTRYVRALTWTATRAKSSGNAYGWETPNGGGTVTIATGAGARDVALVALPKGSTGITHRCYVVNNLGDLVSYYSANNGETWTGTFSVLAGLDIQRADVILTRMNRLLIAIVTASSPYLRWFYSDDLGATFDDNSGDAYDVGGGATANITDLTLIEDDRGNVSIVTAEGSSYVDNPWRVYHGQAEGDPTVDANEQTAGWMVGPDESANEKPLSIGAYAHPAGVIGVVGDVEDSGASQVDLMHSVVARNHAMSVDKLVNASDAGALVPTPCAVAVNAASGDVHVVWLTPQDAGDTVKLKAARWRPTLAQRAAIWPGGQ